MVRWIQTIKANKTVSKLILIYCVNFQPVYCVSAEFVKLLGYFISYSEPEHFQIKTHTHNFMFILFLSHLSILIYHHYCLNPESIVVQLLQIIKSDTTAIKLLFIFYSQFKRVYCISVPFISWWVISFLIDNKTLSIQN